jgi:hypothetical protein
LSACLSAHLPTLRLFSIIWCSPGSVARKFTPGYFLSHFLVVSVANVANTHSFPCGCPLISTADLFWAPWRGWGRHCSPF